MKDYQHKVSDNGFLIMTPGELQVGMYVDLNCSWFKHPFPKKSFKIASPAQLATIRGLGLPSVLVDPQQSNAEAFSPVSIKAPAVSASPSTAAGVKDDPANEALPAAADYCETVHLAGQTYKRMLKRGHHIMKQVSAGSEEGVAGAKAMINALSTLIIDAADSSTIASLFAMEDGNHTGVLHAVNVGTLSMIVARHLRLPPDVIRLVGMAGFLHDFGEQYIPIRILRNRGHLSKTEFLELQRHPDYSVDLLQRVSHIPPEVVEIIICHHERLDGSGYPRHLSGSQLSVPSRIVLVVDEYDSLVHKQREASNLTPSEALGQIYAKAKSLFPEEVVVALIQTLSVYPPGSIVELSDGKVGLVLSLNVEARMRPIVLLYDPSATGDQPAVIDLAKDPGRSIVRSLPKQQLTPAMTSYLSLYRWTGYFIETSLKAFKDPV
jgi:HD-GYP domain-containing protein (c-di-GMP phosphodiesterase class II)